VDRVGVIHEDPCSLIHDGLENEPDAMEILLETMREFGDLETTGQ
jgi:hypothetical protein